MQRRHSSTTPCGPRPAPRGVPTFSGLPYLRAQPRTAKDLQTPGAGMICTDAACAWAIGTEPSGPRGSDSGARNSRDAWGRKCGAAANVSEVWLVYSSGTPLPMLEDGPFEIEFEF